MKTHYAPPRTAAAIGPIVVAALAFAFLSGKAVGLANAPVKTVPGPTVYVDKPVPGPTVYVDVPGPTEYIPGPARTVVRTVKVPRHCPSVADALNGYEALWRESRH